MEEKQILTKLKYLLIGFGISPFLLIYSLWLKQFIFFSINEDEILLINYLLLCIIILATISFYEIYKLFRFKYKIIKRKIKQ